MPNLALGWSRSISDAGANRNSDDPLLCPRRARGPVVAESSPAAGREGTIRVAEDSPRRRAAKELRALLSERTRHRRDAAGIRLAVAAPRPLFPESIRVGKALRRPALTVMRLISEL